MSATAYGRQLSRPTPGLGDRTVQSSTTDGGQTGLSHERRPTETADHHAGKQRPGCRQRHE